MRLFTTIVFCAILAALPLAGGHQALAAKAPSGKSAPKEPSLADAAKLDPGEVDAYLAQLSDTQARRLLRQSLARDAGARQDADQEGDATDRVWVYQLLESWDAGLRGALDRHAQVWDQAGAELARSDDIRLRLTDSGAASLPLTLARILAVAALGLAAFAWVCRANRAWLGRVMQGPRSSQFGRPGLILLRIAGEALAVAAFLTVAFASFLAIVPGAGAAHAMGLVTITSLTYCLLVIGAVDVLLSPRTPALRLVPLDGPVAGLLYGSLWAVTVCGTVLAVCSVVLVQIAGAPALGSLIYAAAGPATGLILVNLILRVRRHIEHGQDAPPCDTRPSLLARTWHYPALAYALGIGGYWSVQAMAGSTTILDLVLSLFLIPGCVGADLWIRRLLAHAAGEDRQIIHLDAQEPQDGAHPAPCAEGGAGSGAGDQRRGIRYFIPLIRKALRVVLVGFAAFAVLRMWGVEIPLGWLLARNVLSVLLVVVGGLLLWEVVRIRIDRRLSEEAMLPGEEMEEGGGAGGSRSATLLMLLRKFLLCVIVVIGGLVVLSSLGVDIAPLIAGAGVVGLAIGFGAQTLVKDIISGVFFLVDDAFRVGDYVEAGTAKGTVEQISLRSMKLRHPRGMVFTIPYGGLKILQNYSRDYIISKLDFRVRYDADIDKIRKIIKRINKELMANEEISRGMLSDIKSMGVRKMEDSAMILRIKFKTVPGHQFLVEKELYRRVQEAFKAGGIEFAHRNVTVYFPPEVQAAVSGGGDAPTARQAAALGAGAALALAEEEERLAAEAAARKKPPEA